MPSLCPDKAFVFECVAHHRDMAPEALCCALRVRGAWVTYSRQHFWDHVSSYASLFRREMSERTLILFSKRLDVHLLAAYLGAMVAGHVPAQVSPPSSKLSAQEYARKIEHVHKITGFGAVFTDVEQRSQFEQVPGLRIYSMVPPGGASLDIPYHGGADALVQFSSGTTGLQKGVTLTHSAIISHMRSYSGTLSLRAEDILVSWLPLYHDMGLIACYLMPLMCGIPFYQMDPFDWVVQPDLLLATIERVRATITFVPNFAYHLLATKGRDHDLSSMRLWVNCSEPARAQSHQAFLNRFPSLKPSSLTVCYALAENTFAATQSLPAEHDVHVQGGVLSCGKPIDGVDLRILDADEQGLGEIGLRSPMLFSLFLDGTRPLDNGYYRTGDLGYLGSSGELFVTGRKKDLIIVCGKNIFPQDVEYVSSQVPGVYPGRTVAFGIWNEALGSEDLLVCAERMQEQDPGALKLAIQKAIQDETGIVPKRVEIFEHMSLVKTSSGKICRSRNRELYVTRKLNPL